MDILRVKDGQGQWHDIPALVGPQGETGIQGPKGDDGISPKITVTAITGGHRITITDADGTKTVDVVDGIDGDDGRGISSVAKTGTSGLVDTYTITYTDGTTSTFTITNGADGADGQSAYVWIRYSATQPTQDSDMKTTPDAWMGIYSGDSATAPTAYTAYTWYNIKGQIGPVSDVQVNGTSVVTDGVANVPVADNSTFGAVKFASNGGIFSDNGALRINKATDALIKSGDSSYYPIVPNNQHKSVFYGLAKAAGDRTQSASSNAVGTYTESAKSAIQSMLGLSYKEIGTITLDEDKNVWDASFDTNVTDAVFVATFVATAQNSAEKDANFELLDANGNIGNGVRATVKYACRVSGNIQVAIITKYIPVAKVIQIQSGTNNLQHFSAPGVCTNTSFTSISGLHFFAPSGFYFAAGSTLTMYAVQ